MGTGEPGITVCLRVLGAILGVADVGLGFFFSFVPHGEGFYRAILVPLGFIVMGAYFLNYALTGRGRLFGPRRRGDRANQLM